MPVTTRGRPLRSSKCWISPNPCWRRIRATGSTWSAPISKKTYPIDDALALFKKQKMPDKEKLFHRLLELIFIPCD